jgi:hypothetical protein
MKAEHRKELQTNVLRDRMERLVVRMKARPQRRFVLWAVLAVVVLIVLFFVYRQRVNARVEESERWVMFEDGYQGYLARLVKDERDTNAGKAAAFQFAWMRLWGVGIRQLSGKQADQAFENIRGAAQLYKILKKECENDPIWEPEAMYALAVIEETQAIQKKERKEHLETAQRMYESLAAKHPNSALGEKAKARAELLQNKSRDILDFYTELQLRLGIHEPLPDFLMPKDKQ